VLSVFIIASPSHRRQNPQLAVRGNKSGLFLHGTGEFWICSLYKDTKCTKTRKNILLAFESFLGLVPPLNFIGASTLRLKFRLPRLEEKAKNTIHNDCISLLFFLFWGPGWKEKEIDSLASRGGLLHCADEGFILRPAVVHNSFGRGIYTKLVCQQEPAD